MRLSITILALLAALTSPVAAAPQVSKVKVEIGSSLTKKTDVMDAREFDYLTRQLQRAIETALNGSGALVPDGSELRLVIEDAKPNRPTMRQMRAKPGLSYQSFGVGGARIRGEYQSASGAHAPVVYNWYETDIRWAQYGSTWSDANRAFDKFAGRLARGQLDGR